MSTGKPSHEYLGDGVYASFDGYHVWLRTGSHDAPGGIALEPSVFASLKRYYEARWAEVKQLENHGV